MVGALGVTSRGLPWTDQPYSLIISHFCCFVKNQFDQLSCSLALGAISLVEQALAGDISAPPRINAWVSVLGHFHCLDLAALFASQLSLHLMTPSCFVKTNFESRWCGSRSVQGLSPNFGRVRCLPSRLEPTSTAPLFPILPGRLTSDFFIRDVDPALCRSVGVSMALLPWENPRRASVQSRLSNYDYCTTYSISCQVPEP